MKSRPNGHRAGRLAEQSGKNLSASRPARGSVTAAAMGHADAISKRRCADRENAQCTGWMVRLVTLPWCIWQCLRANHQRVVTDAAISECCEWQQQRGVSSTAMAIAHQMAIVDQ
ncbi:MAG: hypothetical protein ABIT36_02695 [Steroidobacteraceae bacterium]